MGEGNRTRREPGDRDPVLARIGHELRTPLNSIIGFTGTLLMEMPGPLNEDQGRQLRTVQSSARRLLLLINDLLDLLKIDSGEREPAREFVDCVAVMRDIATLVRQEAESGGSRLVLELPDGGVTIESDPRALRQVLETAAAAIVRLGNGGSIRMALQRLEAQHGNRIAFSVEHDAARIDPAGHARIFEPFASFGEPASQPGSGLELYLAAKLAALLGGTIALDGQSAGTRLVLELPG